MQTPTDTPFTSRLTILLASVERSPRTAFVAGLLLAVACFLVGWHARGLWGVVYDNRGWAALLVFSVVGAVLAVRQEAR